MADGKAVVWGVQQLFVRPGDGQEYQLEACQDAQITANATLAQLMGDDSLVPLDTQPKDKKLSIKAKAGKLSMKAAMLMVGGTYLSNAAQTLSSYAEQESDDSSMKTAIGSLIVASVSALLTDTYTFQALSSSTYTITPSSTGIPSGTLTVSSYPNTTAIPGVSFVCNGTLVQGSTASIKSVATGDTLEVTDQAKNDFAAKVAVRCITENISKQGQWEFLFYLCQSSGITFPLKTKDYAIEDLEFTPLYDTTLRKTLQWRKYSRAS